MGTNYTADEIIINTLQNPVFVGLRNDISFTVGDKLIILIEHQSSVNPNIGLRCLLYIALLYEQLIDKDSLYKSKPMSIANPIFIVLYNGKEAYPEKMTVKLSDLYKVKDGREPSLEVTVTVYNVNAGHSREIMERSRTLDEYAEFVARVREYTDNSGCELTEALTKAVEDSVKSGILREFLEKHGGDVMGILSREWNFDDALRVREEETREDTQEEIAVKLLDVLDIETIAEKTAIPIERVRELKEKHKRV